MIYHMKHGEIQALLIRWHPKAKDRQCTIFSPFIRHCLGCVFIIRFLAFMCYHLHLLTSDEEGGSSLNGSTNIGCVFAAAVQLYLHLLPTTPSIL